MSIWFEWLDRNANLFQGEICKDLDLVGRIKMVSWEWFQVFFQEFLRPYLGRVGVESKFLFGLLGFGVGAVCLEVCQFFISVFLLYLRFSTPCTNVLKIEPEIELVKLAV